MAIDDPLRTTPSLLFDTSEIVFVYLYLGEAIIKVIGLGLIFSNFNTDAYLRDSWNFLDFVIVLTSIISLYLIPSSDFTSLPAETGIQYSSNTSLTVSSLRVLRVLRPLRTVQKVRGLKILIQTLF